MAGPLSLVMSQDQTWLGAIGQQLGLGVGRVGELVAPLAAAAVDGQQPVHGAHRAEVAALVEQRGVHGRRRGVDEALAVEGVQQHLALLRIQGQRRARTGGARVPRPHQRGATHLRVLARAGAPRHRPSARHAALAPRAGVSSCTPLMSCSRACCRVRAGPARRQLFFGPRSPGWPCPAATWSLSRSRVSWAICSASSRGGVDLGAALLRRQRGQLGRLALAPPGAQGR